MVPHNVLFLLNTEHTCSGYYKHDDPYDTLCVVGCIWTFVILQSSRIPWIQIIRDFD